MSIIIKLENNELSQEIIPKRSDMGVNQRMTGWISCIYSVVWYCSVQVIITLYKLFHTLLNSSSDAVSVKSSLKINDHSNKA